MARSLANFWISSDFKLWTTRTEKPMSYTLGPKFVQIWSLHVTIILHSILTFSLSQLLFSGFRHLWLLHVSTFTKQNKVWELSCPGYLPNWNPDILKSNCPSNYSVGVMVFNATFNNLWVIPWWLILLMEKTGVPGENHRPVESHWQTLSHNVVWSTLRLSRILTHNFSGDCIGSCKSNYYTNTTAPPSNCNFAENVTNIQI